MHDILAHIKNDIGNLTCPNCKKAAIISISGNDPNNPNVSMNIDCPKEQNDFCSFFNQLNDKLKQHFRNNRKIKTFDLVDNKLGKVYLYKSGIYYKIGRTKNMERRGREIKLQLPFVVELIHHIDTNNPKKSEKYWHDRFASKRQNGEWFCLSISDVAEFKRIKFM